MKIVTDIRKSTPAMAVVGVTDLAVGALKSARAELSPAKIQADVQNLPSLAISRTLEAAGRAEAAYGELSTRGKSLVDSVRRRSATKELLAQGRSTVTLGKAALTTVRKAGDETLVAAKATLTSGRREGRDLVGSVVREAGSEAKAATPAAKKATKSTRAAAKRTSTTARTRSANVKRATKATGTSARKTATKAVKATKTAAKATGR
jgi:heparin binding hemagglutinin HbhA